jgi:hypothetical protein
MRRDEGLADVMISRLANEGMGKQSGGWPRALLVCFLMKSPRHDTFFLNGRIGRISEYSTKSKL